MALSVRGVSTVNAGVLSSATTGAPTNLAGDRIVAFRQGKPNPDRTPTSPMTRIYAWNSADTLTFYEFIRVGGEEGGTGTFGNDTGPTFSEVWFIDLPNAITNLGWSRDGTESPDNEIYSFYAISTTSGWYQQLEFLNSSQWVKFGEDTSTAANLEATLTFDTAPTNGDMILVSGVQPTDAGASTGHTVTGAGISGGTATLRVSESTVANTDCGVVGISFAGFTGTATGSITASLVTSGSNHSGTLAAVLLREGPDRPFTAASGTASLELEASGMPSGAWPAYLNLSATTGAILPGPWVDLDLSTTQFLYNPSIPSTPFGRYLGGMIQPITFGTGVSTVFQHPDLQFDTLSPTQNYELQVTYASGTTYTWAEIDAYPFTGADSYWNDTAKFLAGIGGFNSTGVPGALSASMGPQQSPYQADWAFAVGSGYHNIVFSFTNRAYITAIRYRTSEPPRAAITGSAHLSLSANDSTPIDVSSPVEVDTTFTTVVNAGTQVGSGNILADGSHTTYYQLDGYNNVTTPDQLLSGWLLIDIPALPNYNSLISLTLTVRAEFYALTGSPTKATLRFFLTNGDAANPIEYSGNYYALVLPGNNYPETAALPTGITDYAYGTDDFQVQNSDMTLSEALAAPLREGRLQLGFAPQRYSSDNYLTTRVQAKVYELSLTIAYQEYVAPVFDDPPDLPDGYGPWTDLDLSTAVFFDYTGVPTGEYDAEKDRILNPTQFTWPDFYFPGFLLDPDNDYMFQFVYDSYDLRDDGTHDLYIWTILASGDPQDRYDNYPSGAYEGADASPGDYKTFLFDSADSYWSTLLDGYTRPVFESARDGVLARIRYAVSPGTPDSYTDPSLIFVDEHVIARSKFWG